VITVPCSFQLCMNWEDASLVMIKMSSLFWKFTYPINVLKDVTDSQYLEKLKQFIERESPYVTKRSPEKLLRCQ